MTQRTPLVRKLTEKTSTNKSTMASKMNRNTHKVISATYTNQYLYAVPIDWDVKDIKIKYGDLYYKQKEQDVPKEEYEPDYKYPNQIEDEDVDIEDYFDCEEEEDLCEKCEDINCCSKDELICCMCCELLKCDMFSQNCGKCLKPMCMNCDNDERKINGENVCEECEEEEEEEEIYYCCDCGVELDRVRDGEEKPDFRCNNCYWEDKEGIDSKNMITPDYRKQEEEEEEEEEEDDDSKCICGELHEACFNCVMCAEPIYQGNFSQNCVLCMNSMCMNCDDDERKTRRGENICENCEEE